MTATQIIEALPIIASLVLIEGLLSVDNALAIAAMASHLPEAQRVRAMRYGIFGAYAFRAITLFIAAWIIANPWIKILGAIYLVYLMCSHLGKPEVDDKSASALKAGFWMTVLQIEIMDLSLSIDNVVAAVALSSNLTVVIIGVFIGILTLRLLAGYCMRLLARFPALGPTAFLLVGYVGFLLLFEMIAHVHAGPFGKFIGIVLIVGLAVIYDRNPRVRAAVGPALRVCRIPMRWFTEGLGFVFSLPLRAVALLRRSPAA